MAGQRFTLTFDANLEVSKMKGALGEIQKSLNGLQLPQNVTKGLQNTFQKLSEEIRNFEVQAGKDITGKTDFSKLEKSADKINGLFEKLKIQIKDLGNLSSKDLEKLLPESVTKNINAANNALKTYNNTLKTIQGTIDGVNSKITEQQNKLKSYQAAIQQLNANKSSKVFDSLKQIVQDTDGSIRFETEAEALQRLEKAYKTVEDALSKYQAKVGQNPTAGQQTYITRLTNQIQKLKKAYNDLEAEGNKNLQLDTQIKALETSSKSAQTQITKLQANLQTLLQGKQGQEAQALQTLLNALQQIQGIDFSKFSNDAQGAGKAVQQYLNENLQKLIGNLQKTEGEVGRQGPVFKNFRQQVADAGAELTNFDNRMREVEQLKSRIQYFFGLNNAIQLVKHTMRDAYNTIKELDKAMTETAVVTDFSVGDMWSQLPEYTKRANELGVTTKAAYEAATLYYQQGLKTNEVMAISNETLKMARIAGLDAAVATDRMTNAVRGFNMEINETNTQRVNDVYSRLAAISASNVDEISTAMTKVASLAHNANMEFETTAAFLAQIIETTRESAETAGTALKTVVARFSEVKELYNKDELEGTDEEGELIDVNKVSKALRTAGIDMNRYFLGEVGIDDIFLELASKWDSLTTLQQRYIATQAAGSRQQSRFIALMSDYARTQELVGEAYNATGASAKQFEKTQESLESKLARLKNAWDEFAMGIANSDLVKLGVDALTGLLNVINSLTSGFGTLDTGAGKFINTFAKLALLIGGLKIGKGLTAGLFGSMLGAVTGGKIGGGFTSIAASAMGVNPGKNLLSTLGAGAINPFRSIGTTAKGLAGSALSKSIWTGAKGLGTSLYGIGNAGAAGGAGWLFGGAATTGAAGTAAGVAGLATAIGGIALAAGAAAIAIKKMYDASPTGQIKIAEKYAASLSVVRDQTKQTADNMKNIQAEYNSLSSAIDNATNEEERAEAIKSRTDYIRSLLEQNSTYAQYLQEVTFEDHEVYLTLDEKKLEEACNSIAEAAVKAATDAKITDANVAFQNYQKYQQEASNLLARKRGNGPGVAQWNDSLEAELINTQALAAQYYEQYHTIMETAAMDMVKDLDVSDTIATAISSMLGKSFDGDEVAKTMSKYKPWGLWATQKEAEDAYKKIFTTTVIPEGLSKKDLINAVQSEYARQEVTSDDLNKITSIFTDSLTDIQAEIIADLIANQGRNIKYSDVLTNGGSGKSFSEIYPYTSQQLTDLFGQDFVDSLEETMRQANPIDVINDQLNDFLSNNTNIKTKLANNIADIIKQFDLTANQASIFPNLVKDFMTYGQGSTDEFIDFINNLIKAVPKGKQNDLLNLLGSLNFQNSGNLKAFLDSLEDLGIDWNSIHTTANDAAEALKYLTNSIEEFDMDSFREEIVDNVSLMRDIKDRKPGSSGYRVFTQDEYDLLRQSGISDDEFAFSGIKNKEWTYTGESLDTLIDVLINGLTQKVIEAENDIDQEIQQGQQIANLGQSTIEALSQVIKSGELTQDQVNNEAWIQKIVTQFRGTEALSLPPDQLLEILKQALQYYNDLQGNIEAKETIQRQASQPMNYITPINEFKPNISQEEYDVAVKSKFYVDEHAEDRYENILKSIQEIDAANANWNKTSAQQETISRALAVNWSEEAAKLEELTEVLDKNDKILYEGAKETYEYSGAIHAVGEAMRAAYGEQVSDEFVQAHIQQIVLARESKEAYQELLDLLQQDFFSNAAQGAEGLAGVLWDVQQEILNCAEAGYTLDGLEINGVAVLDGTPWMKIIEQLIKAGGDVAAFFDTLGWTVVYGPTNEDGIPTSVQLVRNQPTGYGGYQPYTGSNWGRGSTPKSSSTKEPKKEEWRSDFDWLYNLLEDLNELERDQKKLQEEQNKILELGDASTGKDLYENLIKQLANLQIQRDYQSGIQSYRRREMDEFMAVNSQYGNYFRFNDRDQTLEINWDAINNIGDKETYEKVKELVGEAENIQSKMDEAEDSLRDVEKQIRELQNIWRKEYAEFEQRVLDALVKSYQRVIDNYSDLHNTVTESSNAILEAIQNEIDLERQIRDNTQTETEISDMEARLAFLQRDTTGGNQVDILETQRALDEATQSYEDTLVDQAVQRLQEDNEAAALQREKQIELLQAQLDYSVLNGDFNDDVSELLHSAMAADGSLLTDSNLYQLLQQEESWSAMSDVDKAIWEDELNSTFKEVSAFLLKEKSEADGSFAEAIQNEIIAAGGTIGGSLENGLYGIGFGIGSMSQAMDHVTYTYDDAINGLREANAGLAGLVAQKSALESALNAVTQSNNIITQPGNPDSSAYWERQKDLQHQIVSDLSTDAARTEKFKFKRYATGGLNTQTGYAWLDGTSSKPEYVLNALQTDAFLKLADVLPNLLNNDTGSTNNLGSNMYLDFTINVDSLSSDYDVDQLVNRVKDDIYNAASYRNINVVNFLR